MNVSEVLKYLISIVSGGIIWEGIKFFKPEISYVIKRRREVRELLNSNLDPLLRASNELLGKITDYAKTDFTELFKESLSNDTVTKTDFYHNLYLFASFFGRIAMFKNQASFFSISVNKKGRNLLQFIRTFEARRNRLMPKSAQRLIGDSMIVNKQLISFSEFIIKLNIDPTFGDWIIPLKKLLTGKISDENKQKIFLFGVIIHTFLDHFDGKNQITRKREMYKNKLSVKSRKTLRYRVFPEYLNFVNEPNRYY